MGIQTQSKSFQTVDGPLTVQLTQLPATRSALLLIKLGKLFAGGVGSIAKIFVSMKGTDVSQGARAVLTVLPDLIANLTPADFEAVMREVLGSAAIENGKGGYAQLLPMIDVQFQGKPMELFKLVGWALAVNYSDFSDALGAIKFDHAKLGAFLSEPSDTSSGQSKD